MITPDVFCDFYGLDRGILGSALLNNKKYDLFRSDFESFRSLYFNDVWKFHYRTPDVDYYEDKYCEAVFSDDYRTRPQGTTAMFFCLEGI